MRRNDLINALYKVGNALQKSRLRDILVPKTEKVSPEIVMQSFQTYSRFFDTFNENDKKILKNFNLLGLEDPKFWSGLIVTGDRPSNMTSYRMGLIYFKEYMDPMIDTLKQDNVIYHTDLENINVLRATNNSDTILLTVILPEHEGEVSKPARIIEVLESILSFHSVIEAVLQAKDNTLSVAAIDSGSDKSFDLLGAAQFMNSLKDLLISLWDRVVYYKEKQMNERLDLIAKSLPIMEQVAQLEKNKIIDHEESSRLKRTLLQATTKFISCGAIIPEFEAHAYFDPKKLMAPEPKLLNTPHSIYKNELSVSSIKSDIETGLDDDEEEILRTLLAKKKNKGKK